MVDTKHACDNLEKEVKGKSLETLVLDAYKAWENVLSPLTIEGGTESKRRLIYSSLYRSMLMPTNRTGDNAKWDSGADVEHWDNYYCLYVRRDKLTISHVLHDKLMPSFLDGTRSAPPFPSSSCSDRHYTQGCFNPLSTFTRTMGISRNVGWGTGMAALKLDRTPKLFLRTLWLSDRELTVSTGETRWKR
jgi:hypothetical protein